MSHSNDQNDSAANAHPLRILHLEDDAVDAELLGELLNIGGIPCVIRRVETEMDYLAALEKEDIDLILSDSGVPGFSGITALRQAKKQIPDIPFVIVSGGVDPDLKRRSVLWGATNCFPKDQRVELLFLAQQIWQEKLDSLSQ